MAITDEKILKIVVIAVVLYEIAVWIDCCWCVLAKIQIPKENVPSYLIKILLLIPFIKLLNDFFTSFDDEVYIRFKCVPLKR